MGAFPVPIGRTAVLVLALAAAATALVLLLPTQAAARPSADDCNLDAHPFSYAGLVFADAVVTCKTTKGWIKVSSVLTRDGVEVAQASHRCDRRSSCETSTAFADDPPGDQLWCVRASGSTQGGRSLGPIVRCENQAF
jgi:hypothetical protein